MSEEKALVIRNDKGQVVPGSPSPAGGRKKGGTNAVRAWMKESYAEFVEEHGEKANILRFYAETYMNEELDMKIRLDAAKALDRIIFPNHALVVAEPKPPQGEQAERAARIQVAIQNLFMPSSPEPRTIEAPRE